MRDEPDGTPLLHLTPYELSVLAFGSIAFGLFLLIKGGDWTIESAIYIAERAGLSPLFIGATVISFGTSVPELFASVNANISGFPGIALGNVIGSNIANILLVLGATAIVFAVGARPKAIAKDLAMMLLATAILLAGMMMGQFSFLFGAGMFLVLIGFVAYQYCTDSIDLEEAVHEGDDEDGPSITSTQQALLVLGGGLAALLVGSELLVQGAVSAGTALGVPDAVIGLTVVAFGTSLPELSTCVAAARKQATGLILGNIIGSNTFNIMSIVAVTALFKPLDVDPTLVGWDMWFLAALSVIFAIWMLTVGKLTRMTGSIMLAIYVMFVVSQYVGAMPGGAGI
ncbi:MAG: calcium/sodium antiporter [Pseudomonadota bacterium]